MTDRSVLITSLEFEDAVERSAYLDEACRGDTRVRERVGVLLRAHDSAAQSWIDQP